MIEFLATYFDGRSSNAQAVLVRCDAGVLELSGDETTHPGGQPSTPQNPIRFAMQNTKLEPRLGGTRRVFVLPGGARLESQDLVRVAELEAALGLNKGMTWVAWVEARWSWVLFGLMAVLLAGFLLMRFALPWVATQAAFLTPTSALGLVDTQAMAFLDAQYTKPSRLSQTQQVQYTRIFNQVVARIGENPYRFRLLYRQGGDAIGANAFALPGGTVVMTDELVDLAHTSLEVEGVLAHELGHVNQRHSLRRLYQSLGVMALLSAVVGDFVSVATAAGSLPVILMNNGYSQDFERESDAVAARYMQRFMGSTKPLQDILSRLSKEHGGTEGPSLLQTHPGTQERIRELQRLGPPKP